MYNDNYFKVWNRETGKSKTFAFDEYDLVEVYEHAAAVAANSGQRLSVYRMPKVNGPWRSLDMVGHRRDADIVNDIASVTKALEAELAGAPQEHSSDAPDYGPLAVELDNLQEELAERRKWAPVEMS